MLLSNKPVPYGRWLPCCNSLPADQTQVLPAEHIALCGSDVALVVVGRRWTKVPLWMSLYDPWLMDAYLMCLRSQVSSLLPSYPEGELEAPFMAGVLVISDRDWLGWEGDPAMTSARVWVRVDVPEDRRSAGADTSEHHHHPQEPVRPEYDCEDYVIDQV